MVKVRVWSGKEPAGAIGMKNFISNSICYFGLTGERTTESSPN